MKARKSHSLYANYLDKNPDASRAQNYKPCVMEKRAGSSKTQCLPGEQIYGPERSLKEGNLSPCLDGIHLNRELADERDDERSQVII